MHLDADGKVAPYTTKLERIQQLEAAMQAIEEVDTLAAAQLIAKALRRGDKRWRGESPAGFKNVKAVQDREDSAK